MKKLPQHLEDLLTRYTEGDVNESERQSVEALMASDASIKDRVQELQAAHVLLKQISLFDAPSDFTTRVMKGLEDYQPTPATSIRKGVALLAGMLVVSLAAVLLSKTGVFNETTTIDLNQVNVTREYIRERLPTISIDGKVLVKMLVLLNIAVGFVVLDRAILKPFFQRRMQSNH